MGYPEQHKIIVSDTQAYRQFGNSVVVPVVERVAGAVIAALHEPVLEKEPLVMQFGEPRPEDGGRAVNIPKPRSGKRKPAATLV
jgi:hypothetical protein